MNTTQFIGTAKWLISLCPETVKATIFRQDIVHHLVGNKDIKERNELIASIIRASHELVVFTNTVTKNEDAVAVLQAFELTPLLDHEFPAKVVSSLVASEGNAANLYIGAVYPLANAWYLFSNTIPKLETLIVPAISRGYESNDELLTLEIRMTGDARIGADTVSVVFKSINQLYKSILEVLQLQTSHVLETVYVTSGSGFRFDLKGVGDAIKYIKELLIEGWEKIRHRKADDFRHNTKVTLEGLHVLDELAKHRHLDPETKKRLEHSISQSMLDLYEAGALPREIQAVEIVYNEKLMESVQQKLLPAPASSAPKLKPGKPRKVRAK